MVKCLICPKEFKNDAGLAGHMRLSHPSARPVESDKLEARLEKIEGALNGLTKWLGEAENRLDKTLARSTALYILHAETLHGAKFDMSETPELRLIVEQLKRGK